MSFWAGVVDARNIAREEHTRKTERAEEVALRQREREEDRAARREELMLQIGEGRRDALMQIAFKRDQEKAEAEALRGQAQSFLDRIGTSDDPRIAALASDPRTAAELEEKITAIEVEAAKNDIELPPLQGEVLLDLLTVYDSKAATVSPVQITFDDLLSGDFTSDEAYYKAAGELSRPTPRVGVKLSPEAYRMRDPKTLEEGRKAFDQEVLRSANEALANVQDEPDAYGDLKALIEGFGKEGSAERFALMDMFGQEAFSNLAASGNPYIQNLEKDPQLSRYSTLYQLTRIIADPEATQEEKEKAQELLTRFD